LWFHVDGAHGASAILTKKHKPLLKGIEKADSIVWDAHKMLLMPALITAVLFKNSSNSYESFSQKASYLFEKESTDEWYNYAHRTIECTKTMMGLKLYVSLSVCGTQLFSDYITKMYDLTKEFAQMIKDSNDFELAVEPDCNIICFRYLKNEGMNMDEFQKEIRKKVINSEKFYICQTQLKKHFYLRCTVINPLTRAEDMLDLLETIRKI
jgi:L-2,4-diaminobutyrate decarboxylase